ncbi:hypothetical protein AVEN_101186-1 [Araneus ventricosus]|uniref:Uncharacterized protein n=1 Tax=Araneus ventricosus TaxID=182803 RepID=A0A4Y2VSW7_ARAVE|nr:hypothetical protein AVEN_212055-1 [Araneus ventricosus]GBO27366.1 hypothetical protein AVEN_101186-1 [Araneus ventricosus]
MTVPLRIEQTVCLTPLAVCLESELSPINTQTVILVHCIGKPYSPTLNPSDFFLWGHTKDLVYKKKPTDLISLNRSITDSVARTKRKTLELVTDNFVTMLLYCVTSDGFYFESILH